MHREVGDFFRSRIFSLYIQDRLSQTSLVQILNFAAERFYSCACDQWPMMTAFTGTVILIHRVLTVYYFLRVDR